MVRSRAAFFLYTGTDHLAFGGVLTGQLRNIQSLTPGKPNRRFGRFPLVIISHRNIWATKDLHNIFLQGIHPFY